MSLESKLRIEINYVLRGEVVHLYWAYQRETLCGKGKTHRPTLYAWEVDIDWVCEECLAAVGRHALEETTRINEAVV